MQAARDAITKAKATTKAKPKSPAPAPEPADNNHKRTGDEDCDTNDSQAKKKQLLAATDNQCNATQAHLLKLIETLLGMIWMLKSLSQKEI